MENLKGSGGVMLSFLINLHHKTWSG
jgi:hypothetical protein